MELTINVHNMELTPRLNDYVEKKTGRLDRYLPSLAEASVDLSEQHARNVEERQIAQITVRDKNGTILRAEERSGDIFASVDAVVDKIYRQISRYQGKRRRRRRGNNNQETFDEIALGEPLPIDDDFDEEPDRAIVRRKQFSLRPMTVDEAADQMELLGHDFFVFYNGEDDAVNVIYKRRDNNYGLLQPEFD